MKGRDRVDYMKQMSPSRLEPGTFLHPKSFRNCIWFAYCKAWQFNLICTAKCLLYACLIICVHSIFLVCLCAYVCVVLSLSKVVDIFYIKVAQRVHVCLVYVSSFHVSFWEFESRVVIGQWEVLWSKQPAQKRARGHVEFPRFWEKRQKSDKSVDFSKQRVFTKLTLTRFNVTHWNSGDGFAGIWQSECSIFFD